MSIQEGSDAQIGGAAPRNFGRLSDRGWHEFRGERQAGSRLGRVQRVGRRASIIGCTNVLNRGARETQSDRATAYNNRGWSYSDKGDHDRAIADFDEAIRLDPKLAIAFVNRGWSYERKGDYDRAIADYDEAIRLDPNYSLAHNNRGWARNLKGEYDQAIVDFGEAIRTLSLIHI